LTGGAWAYLAAWDVHRAKVFGRCEAKTGIAPFERLVSQVMRHEPYRSAHRVFWIVDNGSGHRGQPATARLPARWPQVTLVHTPLQRARGMPRRPGSSHARALTSTTRLGGKAGRAPASRLLLEAGQALGTEALAPLDDDLARGVQAGRDDVITKALGGEQDDLRADHVSVR
jgi:hypothetical protein